MKTIEIAGVKYPWREVLKMRREQQKAERQPAPTLFELQLDQRPSSQKTASDRFANPTLFEKIGR